MSEHHRFGVVSSDHSDSGPAGQHIEKLTGSASQQITILPDPRQLCQALSGPCATMKNHVGILLQLIALAGLPSIIIFQLFFGFRLIVMPVSLLAGIAIFWLGTTLRES
jgi:hypothetical protein